MAQRPPRDQVPPSVPADTLKRLLTGAKGEEGVDYAAAYLRGDFHPKVIVHGADCLDCEHKLESMGTTERTFGIGRRREFPFRATRKQVEQGGTCNRCGGPLAFDISDDDGGEGGRVYRLLSPRALAREDSEDDGA